MHTQVEIKVAQVNLDKLIFEGASLREASDWPAALIVYQQLQALAPERPDVQNNLAVCLMAVGQPQRAYLHAQKALNLQPSLWQAGLISAKALRLLGRGEEAGKLLAALFKQHPERLEIRFALSEVILHEYTDARLARSMLAGLANHPDWRREVALTGIVSQLYDRDVDASVLSEQIKVFSNAYLTEQAEQNDTEDASGSARAGQDGKPTRSSSSRKRVGFLSPHFSVSPVYFFCFGAIRHLAQAHELVFFNRGSKQDWATAAFKELAQAWFDAKPLSAEALYDLIASQGIDVLFDLGGWMDPVALRALSGRPAQRQYKWVGGQSATTGTAAFDGFIGDGHQSPLSTQHLYSEPLVLLDSGYVSYHAPAYLPAVTQPDADALHVGVISNPVKVSQPFLNELRRQAEAEVPHLAMPVVIDFIDKRYRHRVVCQRVLSILKPQGSAWPANLRVRFIAPKDHKEYLAHVAKLNWVIDTWPYTGGLTTMEALAMGVPCRTRVAELFCERHTYAHCRYAGLADEDIDLDRLGMFKPYPQPLERRVLLPSGSPRLDHAAVANALSALIQGYQP